MKISKLTVLFIALSIGFAIAWAIQQKSWEAYSGVAAAAVTGLMYIKDGNRRRAQILVKKARVSDVGKDGIKVDKIGDRDVKVTDAKIRKAAGHGIHIDGSN